MANLSATQIQTFKTAINGDAALAAARTAGDHGAIAAYYNGAGTGNAWKPSITVAELNTAIVWSEYIALTALKQNGYLAMISGPIDTTNANVRAGFSAIFSGASATNLTALAQRAMTKFEALFASVAGTANNTPVFGQTVTPADVALALGS